MQPPQNATSQPSPVSPPTCANREPDSAPQVAGVVAVTAAANSFVPPDKQDGDRRDGDSAGCVPATSVLGAAAQRVVQFRQATPGELSADDAVTPVSLRDFGRGSSHGYGGVPGVVEGIEDRYTVSSQVPVF